MLHQSKIRKTALSLIYAALMQGTAAEGEFPYGLFWEIALEKETDHYHQALTKSVLHTMRAAAELGGAVIARAELCLPEMAGNVTLLAAREDAEGYLERSKALLVALKELHFSMNDKRRDGTRPLEQGCRRVIQLAQTLCAMGDALLTKLSDAAGSAATEALAGALRHWAPHLRECAALANPLALDAKSEYAGLVRKARALEELRPEAEALAREVLHRREEWENALQRLLRNYVPERLDAVDKSILYLSLYELQCRGLKAPIVISEAINLAHEYSGPKSAPFIHGILAAAAPESSDNA